MGGEGRARNRPVLENDPTSIDESPVDRRRRRLVAPPTSTLFQCLQSDHVRVTQLLTRVGRLPWGAGRDAAWTEAFVTLTAHAHAEEDVIYARLMADERMRARIDLACEAHGEIEDLLLAIDAVTHDERLFRARLDELLVRFGRHVQEEEEEILPLAEALLEPSDLEGMLLRFRKRREGVERELRRLRSGP